MKKVISFVLVLALVLGSFSAAFALTDVDGNTNEEAITVVSDLGIVTGYTDGTFQPEKAVNRAEFAAMITRALAVPDSALAGYTSTSFKDTTGYGWAVKYLAFCDSKGIMLGDGNGNAMPGNTITVNEAITMVLRAVGYTNNSAVLVGNWPGNYVTLAQDFGLYTDVEAAATVDRAAAAQIIYNALTVQKVQVDADGTTNGLFTAGGAPITMLTAGLDCDVAPTAAMVNGTEDAIINLEKYLGAVGKLVTNADNEVVAVTEVETTFITVDTVKADNLTAVDGTKYYAGTGVDFTNYTSTAALFINGAYGTTNTTTVVSEGAVISVYLTGKTITEVVAAQIWDETDAWQFTADDLDVDAATINGNAFVTLEDDSIDYDSFTLVGAAALDKIPEDAVVYVYDYPAGSENAGLISKIVVGTETVTGTITKEDADGYFYINGKAYAEAVDKDVLATSNIGETGTATLDGYGDIYAWEKDDASKDNYAVVVKTGELADAYNTTTAYITMVDVAGVEKEYVVKDADSTSFAGLTRGDIVEYALNKDGKVTTLFELSKAAVPGAVSKTIIGTTPIAKDAVAWTWNSTDATYELSSVDKLDTDATADSSDDIVAYVKNGKIAAMILDEAVLGGTTASYGVINASHPEYDAADEATYWYVEGYVDGKALAAFSDVEVNAAANNSPANSTFSAVIKKISTDADGVVTVTDMAIADMNASTGALVTDGTTTVAGIDGGMVKVEGASTTDFYTLADGYVAYVYDADEDAFVVKKLATNTVKGKTVYMYQTDKDIAGYDLVVVY